MATRNPTAYFPGRHGIALNGVAQVTVLGPPPSSSIGSDFLARKVLCLRISNIDTALVNITLLRVISDGTPVQIDKSVGLAIDGVWSPVDEEHPIMLQKGDRLVAVMSAPPATNQPFAWAEFSDVRSQN